jgi:hypothetical protein
MQRRHFIAGCSAALVAAGTEPLQRLTTPGPDARQTMTRKRFETLIGSEFRLYADRRFVDRIRLESIDDGPSAAGLEQFTLRWKGYFSERLPEGIYTLEQPDAPPLELAIEPDHSPGHPRYRSTFNLLS